MYTSLQVQKWAVGSPPNLGVSVAGRILTGWPVTLDKSLFLLGPPVNEGVYILLSKEQGFCDSITGLQGLGAVD